MKSEISGSPSSRVELVDLKYVSAGAMCFGGVSILSGLALAFIRKPSEINQLTIELIVGLVGVGLLTFFLLLVVHKVELFTAGGLQIFLKKVIHSEIDKNSPVVASAVAAKLSPELKAISEEKTTWLSSDKAFEAAAKSIESFLESDHDLEIRLIAISMSQSWSKFVVSRLYNVIRNPRFSDRRVRLRLAVVEPSFLDQFSLNGEPPNVDHQACSRALADDLARFKQRLKDENLDKVLTIEISYYEGFPQWHGIFLKVKEDETVEIYLGRVDWKFQDDAPPELLCGEYSYRFFDLSTDDGLRRIGQFRHWFQFYSGYKKYRTNPRVSSP